MTSQHDEPTLTQVQEEFGHGWLCWPGPSSTCCALQLDQWYSQGGLSVIQASDPAGLRDQIRSIQDPSPPPPTAAPDPGTPSRPPAASTPGPGPATPAHGPHATTASTCTAGSHGDRPRVLDRP